MKQTKLIMGMPITVEVAGGQPKLFDQVFAELNRIDATYSTYKEASIISRLNRGELKRQDLDAEVRWVLDDCDRYRAETSGFFDMTRPDGAIDPSGLVKGWAIKKAADLIRKSGANNFFVSAGGDVQTAGHNADGQPWRVGIRNPFESDKFAKTVALSGQAIATSGTYERGAHIYNPHTGQPVTDIVSLSVIGADIYDVDILATAAFAMGKPGLNFLAEHSYEAMMITAKQEVLVTAGFNRYEA